MLKILQGSIVAGKSGIPMKVVSLDGEVVVLMTNTGEIRAKLSAILQVISPQPAATTFNIGDRVTLADKYQVRAADIGTVEAFTPLGIQVLWDNHISLEPNLKQPPIAWRTFRSNELELVPP
jgi:hypothetical protein